MKTLSEINSDVLFSRWIYSIENELLLECGTLSRDSLSHLCFHSDDLMTSACPDDQVITVKAKRCNHRG